MANIFTQYKQVRAKTKILAEDFNGLQASLTTSFDTLGEPLSADAIAGSRGVSTPFSVGNAVNRTEAVTKGYMDDLNLDGVAIEADRVRAEAAANVATQAVIDANLGIANSHVHTDLVAAIEEAELLALAGI